VFVVPPSPNVHDRFVIVPVELSVKITASDTRPVVGVPLKLADGMVAPEPIAALVEEPPLLAKITEFVKLPTDAGLNATLTVPVWPPDKL
jgi:hypothetical protein